MSAPAHQSVLAQEAVAALDIQPAGTYVDATFGRGGHSRLILERLGGRGRLIVLDRDPAAMAVAGSWADPRVTAVHRSFAHLGEVLEALGVGPVDGLLLDLGVSSPQIDEASRGFSFRLDGPLDMRMDTTQGMTAREWLASATEDELRGVIRDYGEERFAKQVARAIVAARAHHPLTTTRELARVVGQAVRTREPGQDPATRTFQAIRIYINQELEELSLVLAQSLHWLKPGGRLVVISFHSLEDRIVKRFMREAARADRLPARLPVRALDVHAPRLVLLGKAVRPSDEEVQVNPSARSAILRAASRTEFPA